MAKLKARSAGRNPFIRDAPKPIPTSPKTPGEVQAEKFRGAGETRRNLQRTQELHREQQEFKRKSSPTPRERIRREAADKARAKNLQKNLARIEQGRKTVPLAKAVGRALRSITRATGAASAVALPKETIKKAERKVEKAREQVRGFKMPSRRRKGA
jgi:hypothetical protein